jgi:hypothetical protein
MNKCLAGFIALLVANCMQAQETNSSSNKLHDYLNINVGAPNGGVQLEKIIGSASSLNLFAGYTLGYVLDDAPSVSDYFKFNTPAIAIAPDTYLEYKYYYNCLKRSRNNKNTKNNGFNYVFGKVETIYAVKNQNYFGLLFAEGWGLQRCLYKHINFNVALGVAEQFVYNKPPDGNFNYIFIKPYVNFSFNYLFKISKKQKCI